MFLVPQHFQAQDQYFEDLLRFRLSASLYANYGVTQLEIDAEALSNGLVKLNRARGVLPDGEMFDSPDSDELPDSRELTNRWPSDQETLDVFLSLPEWRTNSRNVTFSDETDGSAPARTRYIAETRMLPDANLGFDEKPVQLGRKTFRLLFGNEFRDGFNSLRIAKISRDAAGTPVIHPSFVAPCLELGSSSYLMSLLKRQVEMLITRSSGLSGPRRERGKATADFSASETANFWLLHTVNTYLPELRHIYKVRRGHPEAAYLAMLRLAGALSTFSIQGSPADLPDYDHDDLGLCFSQLDARVRDLMETVIPSKYRAIPLSLTDRQIWSGTVEDDNLFRRTQFFLAVSAEMGVDDVIRKIPQYLKVSAPDEIERLIRNALSGVTLRHVQAPPAAIPVKLDNQYFAFNQSGPIWERIVMSRQVSVFAPSEIADPKMEVVVVME